VSRRIRVGRQGEYWPPKSGVAVPQKGGGSVRGAVICSSVRGRGGRKKMAKKVGI